MTTPLFKLTNEELQGKIAEALSQYPNLTYYSMDTREDLLEQGKADTFSDERVKDIRYCLEFLCRFVETRPTYNRVYDHHAWKMMVQSFIRIYRGEGYRFIPCGCFIIAAIIFGANCSIDEGGKVTFNLKSNNLRYFR